MAKAIRIERNGGPEELQLVDVTVAEPGPGEIRIMKASGEVLLPVTDGDLQELAKGRVTKTAQTMARKVIRERK